MTQEIRECKKEDCDVEFEPRSHNQIYCSKAHQKIETNRKIMERYYANKRRKSGETRICTVCNFSALSQYNDSTVCRSCEIKAGEARDAKAISDIGRFVELS